MTRALLLALVLLVLGAGSWAYLARDAAPAARQWRSATIDRGPLVRSIAASGTLRPVIDSEFALVDAAKAHHRIESSGHIGKIVLKVA